jgi:glycosyltransferase involved in cell wall biosynthesis
VPPGDPATLAEAVADLLADSARARSLGEAAAAAARDRFAWRRVAEDLLAVHRQAIDERRGRR